MLFKKYLIYRWFVFFPITMYTVTVLGQNTSDPESFFALSGVSAKTSQHTKIYGYAGINPQLNLKLLYAHCTATLNKYIVLDPGYMYVATPRINDLKANEHTLWNIINFTLPLKHINIEDRNLFWNRLRKNFDDLNFYRNRLRIFFPVNLRKEDIKLTPYIYNEAFYFFNESRWSRNRIAVGILTDIKKCFTVDVSYARQHDFYTGNMNIFFIILTVQLEHWGVFLKRTVWFKPGPAGGPCA